MIADPTLTSTREKYQEPTSTETHRPDAILPTPPHADPTRSPYLLATKRQQEDQLEPASNSHDLQNLTKPRTNARDTPKNCKTLNISNISHVSRRPQLNRPSHPIPGRNPQSTLPSTTGAPPRPRLPPHLPRHHLRRPIRLEHHRLQIKLQATQPSAMII